MNTLQQVILTLQCCLETLEQAWQCGHRDPCTKGQGDLAYRNPGVEFPQCEYGSVLDFWWTALLFFPWVGFLSPSAISANSRNLLLVGIEPWRSA